MTVIRTDTSTTTAKPKHFSMHYYATFTASRRCRRDVCDAVVITRPRRRVKVRSSVD